MKKMVKAVIALAFFVSSLFVGVKGIQASTNTEFSPNNNKNSELLVLKHAKELFKQSKDGTIKLAWGDNHYSHSSHDSHYSHSSHDSHSSHYSSSY